MGGSASVERSADDEDFECLLCALAPLTPLTSLSPRASEDQQLSIMLHKGPSLFFKGSFEGCSAVQTLSNLYALARTHTPPLGNNSQLLAQSSTRY